MQYSIINVKKPAPASGKMACVGQLKQGDTFSRDSGMTWWRVWDVKSHGCGDVSLTALPKRAPFRFVTERYDLCDKVLQQEVV